MNNQCRGAGIQNVIGHIGSYTIFSIPNDHIEPGRQWIAINDASLDAGYVLAVLTGAEPHTQQETAVVAGVRCRLAAHDAGADQRLRDLVDLAADLRFKAPELMQLCIEGFDDERPA